jgi:uncharacterized MnhB-related membrane protein
MARLFSWLLMVLLALASTTAVMAQGDTTAVVKHGVGVVIAGVLLALLKAAEPMLSGALSSGIFWLVSKFNAKIAGMNNWFKRGIILAVGSALGYLGSLVPGLDVSGPAGAASSLIAMVVYWLGKKA